MDYAIYKTIDGKHPRVIYRFRQDDCNHRAKWSAMMKLHGMWIQLINHPDFYRNAKGNTTEFSYDYLIGGNKTEKIRFYIAKL